MSSWEFWREIVTNPDGSLNVEQVQKELADYYEVLQRVPKVYTHITDGRVSKILTDPDVVIDLARQHCPR